MSSPDHVVPRMVEVTGAEALWLMAGVRAGRLVFTVHNLPAIRPAGHRFANGTLVVRAPIPATALAGPGGAPALLVYHADEFTPDAGGWSATATGPAERITDPYEAAHYRGDLPGWAHGPHDLLIRIRPQLVHGHRLHPGGVHRDARITSAPGTGTAP